MFCIILAFCSAAKSSCKFAIGSPLQAKTDAVNGYPAAACGYTSTPCGVCLLFILEEFLVIVSMPFRITLRKGDLCEKTDKFKSKRSF